MVAQPVHCRIGSSENDDLHVHQRHTVHCRIGSSEMIHYGDAEPNVAFTAA